MSAAAGFSLLEMLLVVLLIGLLATITAVSIQRGLTGARGQAATDELATALRRARVQAMAGGRVSEFRLDLVRHGYRIDAGPWIRLPDGVRLGMRFAREADGGGSHIHGSIDFYPDGSSSGGQIQLQQGGRRWQLKIAWLTGAVVIHTPAVGP